MNLKFSLRLLAAFFWWYLIVFVLSVLPSLGAALPSWLIPKFRGENYVWDFELMFTAIFVVWGAFLWKASNDAIRYKTFISFTLWATAAHIAAMLVIGFIRVEDFQHMLIDAVALSLPLLLLAFNYRKVFAGGT